LGSPAGGFWYPIHDCRFPAVASMPQSILDPVRTLTGNVVIEIGYAHGEHQEALFATGAVLFIFIMVLNLLVNLRIVKKEGDA